jgi:predicted acyl esterase
MMALRLVTLPALTLGHQKAQQSDSGFTRTAVMVPMRDGVHLNTRYAESGRRTASVIAAKDSIRDRRTEFGATDGCYAGAGG